MLILHPTPHTAIWRGLTMGLSQGVTMGSYGLMFWYGGGLVIDQKFGGSVTFQKMLRSLMAGGYV
jgi:hypothetical protein